MKEINWNKVKFRASSWGNLMTEPVSKADKEAGKLSATCQKELIKLYCQLKYGRKRDVTTKQMDKGKRVEDQSIALFSLLEGELFLKNEQQLENEWFSGHLDIYSGESIKKATAVWDIKSRWDLETFMPKLMEPLDKGEELQLQVYFDLTGATQGGIANTLIDCPPEILMEEKRRLLYAMDVVSEESPAYLKATAELERLLTFPDIPMEERVIKQPCTRNDELIEKMKAKVPIMRAWLAEFEKKHLSQYSI